MAGRKLAVTTIVTTPPGTGESFAVFGPDDDVPKWAADQIGDHCWADGSDDDADDAPDEASDEAPDDGSAPPRSGKGSGRPAWAAFADGKVDVTDDDSRDAIIGKLEAAGHVPAAE